MPSITLTKPAGSAKTTLSPGARILLGRDGKARVWSTLTTAFVASSQTFAVTAGHGARGGNDDLLDPLTRKVAGALRVNLLAGVERRDLALYLVAPAVEILDPKYHAEVVDAPKVGAAYTATRGEVREAPVLESESSPPWLLDLLGSQRPLIRCPRVLGDGDSGAPLYQARGARVVLVGLHTGNDAEYSYFTPLDGVIQAAISRV